MKNLSSYLFEGFFNNIGNDKDVARKKAIQNFDALINDCVKLLKDMASDVASNTKDKSKLVYSEYEPYRYIGDRFRISKQYSKLIDVFKFLIENHDFGIIVSTESGGKRDIKPGEFEAFREYGANIYNDISEFPTTTTYRDPSRAADGFFPVLYTYALGLYTRELGLSTGNYKIQDIYLIKV